MTIEDATRRSNAGHRYRIPSRSPRFYARPRLDDTLELLRTGARRVVFVWSAAGSGKTSLLSDWARRLTDDGLRVWWFNGQELTGSVSELRKALDSAQRPEEASPGVSRVIFIDDIHLAPTSIANGLLTESIERLPPDVGVIIAGRYQPLASLIYLQASGQSVELRTADLAFTAAEAAGLAACHECDLEEPLIEMLVRRTGGWATALALAMPWLDASADPQEAVARFDGDHRAVADYLVDEVLETLSPDEQKIVTHAAIREHVPLELVAEVCERPDAGAVLHRVSRSNTLIGEDSSGYHFHPILLSFLQAEARRRDPDSFISRHVKAYQWYADRGGNVEAVEEAMASRDRSTIREAIERFGLELILAGDTALMFQATSLLPFDNAPLAVLATGLLLEAPDFADGMRVQHLFTEAFRHEGTASGTDLTWLGAVFALHCMDTRSTIPISERLKRIGGSEITAIRQHDLALDLLLTVAEGWAIGETGDPAHGERMLREAGASAHRAGYPWLFLVATELATRTAVQAGQWDKATALEDRISVEVLERAHPLHDRARAAASIIVFTHAYRHLDPLPLNRLDEIVAADPLGTTFGLLGPALVLRRLPELDSEPNPRSSLESLGVLLETYGVQYPRLFAAAAVRMTSLRLMLDGRARARQEGEALIGAFGEKALESALIRFVLDFPDRLGHPMEEELHAALERKTRAWASGSAVSAWLLLAEAADQLGRDSEADRAIACALRLAHRVGTLRPFLARNGTGIRLVEPRIGRLGSQDAFAMKLQHKARLCLPVSGPGPNTQAETLTAREHEILRELPIHQTVAEIAGKQTLSVNTIKTHLRGIYQKLGVADRADAVAMAKAHGLL